MPKVSVTIITLDEAAHIAAAIDSAAWADEVIVVDSGSTDDTVAIARAKGAAVEVRPWTGWVDQKNFASGLAHNDWIFSLDADERITPALAAEIRRLLETTPPLNAYRVPRVTFHLGRWWRTTDFYPDYQARLYNRRIARWDGKWVHESIVSDGPLGRLSGEIEHYSFRDLSDQIARLNTYSTLAAHKMLERGRRATAFDLLVQAPAAFLRNYLLRRGILDGSAGLLLSLVNAWGVFLKFAKLWELQRESPGSQPNPGPQAQDPNRIPDPRGTNAHVLSLHISTSRTWRGTENHAMHIVLGLREMGDRAVLVAHPDGELRRRLSEGLDVIPLAPSQDVDLAAAWRLSRVLRQLRPEVLHAYDQYAVSMAAVALSITAPRPRPPLVASRRLDVRLPHHSFAKWKYGEADCFIANSAALRHRLVADGIPAARIRVVHEGVDIERVQHLAPVDAHAEFYLPHNAPVIGSVGALVAQKGHAHLVDAAALVVREVPDARLILVGEGDQRPHLEEQIRHRHLERHVFLAGFREDALALTKAFDVLAVGSTHEGLPIALVDAMAAGKAAVATRVGGIPEVMVDGETGFLVEPRDPPAMAAGLVALLSDPALRARMGEAALARARERFSVERMVAGTAAVYRSLVADTARRAAAD